jgi:N-acetyl-alpha-D-glucosaminyl L-malate synthase BshA
MKIGIVLYPTFGGSGVVGTELGKALAQKGHEIHFITYSQPVRLGTFRENIFYHEVAVSDYPLFDYQPYETELTSKMVDVALFENLDLFHVHYAIPHASAAYMARQILKSKGKYIPFITTLHGTDITLVGKDPSFEPVITFCINESDAVTAVSESLKADTYAHFEISRDIRVVPNFISADSELDELSKQRRCNYAGSDEFILCHISNFRKVKRVEDVVRVFHLVSQAVDAKLILAGDGPERLGVERLVRDLNLHHKVIFLGKIRDTTHVLELADIFLLPSETESFGLAALEAMSVGVPVISSNTGGIPEVNVQGKTGFLSDVGNVDEMAENCLYLLQDPERLNVFKSRARTRAADFDLERVLPMYEEIYSEVTANRKRSQPID